MNGTVKNKNVSLKSRKTHGHSREQYDKYYMVYTSYNSPIQTIKPSIKVH
jgi:hypothetical protein